MVQKYETIPIRELTDFHNKPEYKLLIDNNVAVESYLSISTDTEYQKLWAKVKKESGVLREAHSGENMIKKDAKKILLSSSPLFENSHDSYPCEIETTRYSYGQERVAFAFNNESVYIKLFDYHIKRALEIGVKRFPYDERTAVHCDAEDEAIFRPMSFSDICSAFVIVGAGGLLALISCFFESRHKLYWLLYKIQKTWRDIKL